MGIKVKDGQKIKTEQKKKNLKQNILEQMMTLKSTRNKEKTK